MTTVHCNPTDGVDTNNGLTEQTARKTIRETRKLSALQAGGRILIAPGVHIVFDDDIKTKSGTNGSPIVVEGGGATPADTVLDFNLTGGGLDKAMWISSVSYWTFRNLTIRNAANNKRALRVEDCSNIIVEDVVFDNIGRNGIRASGDNLIFRRCVGTDLCMWNENFGQFPTGGWDTGFGTTTKTGGVLSSNVQFIDCRVERCWGESFAAFNGTGLTFQGCTAKDAISVHFYTIGASDVLFNNCVSIADDPDYVRIESEVNLQRAFTWASEAQADTAPTGLTFTNNRIIGNGKTGVAFRYATYGSPSTWNNQYYDDVVIENNRIENVTGYGLSTQQTISPTNEPLACVFRGNKFKGVNQDIWTNIHASDLAAWTLANNAKIKPKTYLLDRTMYLPSL